MRQNAYFFGAALRHPEIYTCLGRDLAVKSTQDKATAAETFNYEGKMHWDEFSHQKKARQRKINMAKEANCPSSRLGRKHLAE